MKDVGDDIESIAYSIEKGSLLCTISSVGIEHNRMTKLSII